MRVQPHCMVTISYRIDSEPEGVAPNPKGPFRMQALVGYDRLPPVLEEALLGLREGDTITVSVSPEALFGANAQEAATSVPLAEIIDPSGLQVGHIHHIMDQNSRLKPFRVVEIGPQSVLADFNPPRSSHPVRFNVRIKEVRWATLEEIKKASRPIPPPH